MDGGSGSQRRWDPPTYFQCAITTDWHYSVGTVAKIRDNSAYFLDLGCRSTEWERSQHLEQLQTPDSNSRKGPDKLIRGTESHLSFNLSLSLDHRVRKRTYIQHIVPAHCPRQGRKEPPSR
ncbi:hypothetical protein LIA77_01548 [Sarocladium implicatum]|nr:hypothetical protein LIA77_01548 [Sarocladium implicatum]